MSITKNDCIGALRNAGLSDVDAEQTVAEMLARKKRLEADGKLVKGDADLAAAVIADHDAARLKVAQDRRQTAINIMRRMKEEKYIAQVKEEGYSFTDALKAILVGSTKRFFGARNSIDARRAAIEGKWGGQLANEFEAIGRQFGGDQSVVFGLMAKDKAFQLDFAREVATPGSTNNKMAAAVADAYTRLSEEMRLRHNDSGAYIGRLEGRLPQSHDVVRLLDKKNGGQEGWVRFVEEHLDSERSFPGKTQEEVRDILSNVYSTIVSGRDLNLSGAEKSQVIGPRNIASGLGKHRVLHFRDADAAIAYHEKYGRGTLVNAINDEIVQGARRLSLMERLGPNPEHMLRSMVEAEKDSIRLAMKAGTLDAAAAEKQLNRINRGYNTAKAEPGGSIANWMKALTGETSSPVDVGVARFGSTMRAWMSMTKLGGAMLSALADPFTKAASLRVNGVGFLERYQSALFDYMKQYKGREREIARELGFLTKSTLGAMLHRFDPADSTPGRVSKAMNHFFKYSGIDFVTESGKVGYAMRMSQHIANARQMPFEKLIPEIKAMLEYHGVDAKTWDVWRQMTEGAGNNRYFNPAMARNLTDAQIAHLLPEHLQEGGAPKPRELSFAEPIRRKGEIPAEYEQRLAAWQTERERALLSLEKEKPFTAPERLGPEAEDAHAARLKEWQTARAAELEKIVPPEFKGTPEQIERQVNRFKEKHLPKELQKEPARGMGDSDARYEKRSSAARKLYEEELAKQLPDDLRTKPRRMTEPEGYGEFRERVRQEKEAHAAKVQRAEDEHALKLDAWQRAQRREFDRIRQNLETDARAFFADDTKFAIIEPDAATTAFMTQGIRPGTGGGEAIRAMMQFKSFPIAYWQRQIGGRRWRRGGETTDIPGAIEFTVSALAFGYMAMTLKDISKNRTPRDPLKKETWFAAAMQSGGLGIFGDFFLGKVNRFGGGFTETLAGPFMGELGNLVDVGSHILHGEGKEARDLAIRSTMNNMPYLNLWYTRAAMDWLLLDRIKEAMSPGYKRRMRQNMEKEFGQQTLIPY